MDRKSFFWEISVNFGVRPILYPVAIGAAACCAAVVMTARPAIADDSNDNIGAARPDASVPTTDSGAALAKAAVARSMARAQSNSVAALSTTTTYTSLSVTGQMQQTTYWCGPASARMALSVFGVTKSQSTLAGDLGTTSVGGTYASAIPGVLNHGQSSNSYVDSKTTSSSTDLFARVKLDVQSYSAPLIPLIEAGDLPLWEQNRYAGDHFVTLYGYASDDAMIQYDDPIYVQAMYGKHVTNKKFLFTAMNDELDNELVW